MSTDRDQAHADAMEARAEAKADAWMYVTRLEEDAAEERYERRNY